MKFYGKMEYMEIPSRTVTSSDDVTVNDHVVIADCSSNDIVLTLPPIADFIGNLLKIKKIGTPTYTLTLDGYGSEVIDDELSYEIRIPYTSMELVKENGKWWIF